MHAGNLLCQQDFTHAILLLFVLEVTAPWLLLASPSDISSHYHPGCNESILVSQDDRRITENHQEEAIESHSFKWEDRDWKWPSDADTVTRWHSDTATQRNSDDYQNRGTQDSEGTQPRVDYFIYPQNPGFSIWLRSWKKAEKLYICQLNIT